MLNRAAFFASVRTSLFGGTIAQDQVEGIGAILDEWERRRLLDLRHLAYMLATAMHETGARMQPIVENLNYTSASRIRQVWPKRFPTTESAQPYVRNPQGLARLVYGGRLGSDKAMDGYNFRGRGLAQITGKGLYAAISKLVGRDLVDEPEAACEMEIAVRILFDGMIGGLYTGKKLADYITKAQTDFVSARAIVNADVALNGRKIANEADRFLIALKQAELAAPDGLQRQRDDPGSMSLSKPKPAPVTAPVAAIGIGAVIVLGAALFWEQVQAFFGGLF